MNTNNEPVLNLRDVPLYYVCFRNTDQWYRRFFKTGFSHCFLLINDGINWIEFNPLSHLGNIEIIPVSAADDIVCLYKIRIPELSVIEVEFNKKSRSIRHFIIPHCANMVNYILGINIPCWTPYAFYKKLLKLNSSVRNMKSMCHKDFHDIKSVRKVC